ncbi:translation initiation factor 2 [Desulfovibrio sp.]|uniref:translation initiation factor 2 n=1 Tax=Desulfovibrio sp. TaxID=885 RepID=UPI0023BE7A84|nr:translation initiation factor 2 [Desulfovibrio sp.]MDE7241753.1 translation initiation factor 2 [Desulfovibrio sp.]
MRTLVFLVLALVALARMPCLAAEMHVTKGLTHYARDMEYYYQKPRPEVLPGLLRTLASQGVLGHGEKRLVVAAFLGELARQRMASLEALGQGTEALPGEAGADARRTLAWAAHLGGLPGETQLLDSLLTDKDVILRGQITRSPAPLSAWQANEPAVPRMFWGAYMASGNPAWLDRLLDEAERYARLNAAGRQGEPGFAASAAAAALLYDMAPRHAGVRERARARLAGANGPEADALRLILRQSGR